jgi:hypothetical protein
MMGGSLCKYVIRLDYIFSINLKNSYLGPNSRRRPSPLSFPTTEEGV